MVKAQINPAEGKEPADTRAPPERSLPLARAQVAKVTPAITALAFLPPPLPAGVCAREKVCGLLMRRLRRVALDSELVE
jgi:hypothetical protein